MYTTRLLQFHQSTSRPSSSSPSPSTASEEETEAAKEPLPPPMLPRLPGRGGAAAMVWMLAEDSYLIQYLYIQHTTAKGQLTQSPTNQPHPHQTQRTVGTSRGPAPPTPDGSPPSRPPPPDIAPPPPGTPAPAPAALFVRFGLCGGVVICDCGWVGLGGHGLERTCVCIDQPPTPTRIHPSHPTPRHTLRAQPPLFLARAGVRQELPAGAPDRLLYIYCVVCMWVGVEPGRVGLWIASRTAAVPS